MQQNITLGIENFIVFLYVLPPPHQGEAFECEHRLKPNDSANKETGGASPSPTEIKRDPLFVRRRKIVRTTSRAIRESPLQMLINIRRVAVRQCEQRYGSSKAPTPTEV